MGSIEGSAGLLNNKTEGTTAMTIEDELGGTFQ